MDCLTHQLTGAQVLFHLMNVWRDNPNQPVTLWFFRGEAEKRLKSIRVALSKERSDRDITRTFELRFSESWPHTHDGIKGEAMKVTRVSGGTTTRLNAAFAVLKNSTYKEGLPDG